MADCKRVLVVDDEEMMRDFMSCMLEAEGFTVTLAENGEVALREIGANPPDLVILDLKMPGGGGWELIDRLRDHPAPPPVVAMSGTEMQEPPELRAVSRFVYGYLPKPFTTEQLVKTCARALFAARPSPPSEQTYADRRQEARREILVPATLISQDGTPAAMGQILNLSTGGAQLDLGAPLQRGMEMTLSFEIPGGHGPFRVTGRIQWRKDSKLGLMFTNLSADDRQRLGDLLGTTD